MTSKLVVPMSNRTNYTKIRPVLFELQKHPEVDVSVILSSAILLDEYGGACKDIEKDGFRIAANIDCLFKSDSLSAMSKTVAVSLLEHTSTFDRIEADGMMLVGDRFDILGSVLAARMLNVPIFHIQGGEITGSIDDAVRDMISVCSSRHYVATDAAAERLKSIVKQPENIFNYGCPAVEMIAKTIIGDPCHEVWGQVGLSYGEEFFLIALHPNTDDKNDVDFDVIMDGVNQFGKKCLIFQPNPDAFNSYIRDKMNAMNSDRLRVIKHLPVESFVVLMAHTKCMIGNSSAGIREAASFGTPVVNIGKRQRFRERNHNVIDVDCGKNEIADAITKSLEIGRYERKNIYYKTDASKLIASDIVSTLTEKS